MSRYNRYPVSGMTDVQIYTGTVSIQYRDTTKYGYTAHPCFETANLSFPLPFQRSTDRNGPDNLYRSSDLGEPRLSGSLCCDKAQILS